VKKKSVLLIILVVIIVAGFAFGTYYVGYHFGKSVGESLKSQTTETPAIDEQDPSSPEPTEASE